MTTKPKLPIIPFASQVLWEAWLEDHHATSDGVWFKIAKKGSGIETVSYVQALEVALCYGWIDGQKASLDEDYWLQRFTPRRARSKWSKVNRQKATKLIESAKMRPAGLWEVGFRRWRMNDTLEVVERGAARTFADTVGQASPSERWRGGLPVREKVDWQQLMPPRGFVALPRR